MNTDTKAKKVFFISLAASILIVGAYWYTFVKILRENIQVAALSSSIQALTKQRDVLASLSDRVKSTEDDRSKIDGYFIPRDGVVVFLNKLQSLADENGLDMAVNSVAIEDSPLSPDIFEVVDVSFTGIGEWSNVYRFVSLINLMPLKIFVDGVDLEWSSDSAASANGLVFSKKKGSATHPLWKAVVDLRVMKLK